MAEKLEIEILANGKPAEKAIKGVEQKTDNLGKTTEKTGKNIDGVLSKMRVGWIAVGAAAAKAISAGKEFERVSLGLTEAQKEWAIQTSLASDATAAQVAGFLKSAETAGLAEEQMKALAEQAIALGYAFPHEDAETLHDNLVMLNTTGEAQGFIVDILEQKLSKMGIAFEDIDLKALSAADKIALVGEVSDVAQKQMDSSAYKDVDRAITSMNNGFISLGNSLVNMLDKVGIIWALNKAIAGVSTAFNSLIWIVAKVNNIFDDSEEAQTELTKASLELTKSFQELSGMDFSQDIADLNAELAQATIGFEKTAIAINDTKGRTEELKTTMTSTEKEMKKLGVTGQDVAKGLGDYFANMVMGVKTSFSDMARSILANLVRVRTEAAVTKALAGTSFGDLFSFHTGGEVKHTGGAIGRAGIPSYHTGYRSDERLAKLQVGEAVVNRHGAAKNKGAIDAMNKGYQVGGNGADVTTAEINFNVQAIDAASFNNYLVNNKDTIEGIINSSLVSNGSVRRTIKQVV